MSVSVSIGSYYKNVAQKISGRAHFPQAVPSNFFCIVLENQNFQSPVHLKFITQLKALNFKIFSRLTIQPFWTFFNFSAKGILTSKLFANDWNT